VKGNSLIGANAGAGYDVCNSLFLDSTACVANGIQNNYPSTGRFENCTFGRGCSMSARTNYGINSVSIVGTNCANVDSLKVIRADTLNRVSLVKLS
jgi:hypothetical protein